MTGDSFGQNLDIVSSNVGGLGAWKAPWSSQVLGLEESWDLNRERRHGGRGRPGGSSRLCGEVQRGTGGHQAGTGSLHVSEGSAAPGTLVPP